MSPIQSLKVKNKHGEVQVIDVFAGPTGAHGTDHNPPRKRTLLKGRNGRRARKLDKGVYEIDGLAGLYRTGDPAAP